MSEITAEELLNRIRAARAAADAKASELKTRSEVGNPDQSSLAQAMKAQSYRTVIDVLDMIIEPSK